MCVIRPHPCRWPSWPAARGPHRSLQLNVILRSPLWMTTSFSSSSDTAPSSEMLMLLTSLILHVPSRLGMTDRFLMVTFSLSLCQRPGASPTSLHSWQTSLALIRWSQSCGRASGWGNVANGIRWRNIRCRIYVGSVLFIFSGFFISSKMPPTHWTTLVGNIF